MSLLGNSRSGWPQLSGFDAGDRQGRRTRCCLTACSRSRCCLPSHNNNLQSQIRCCHSLPLNTLLKLNSQRQANHRTFVAAVGVVRSHMGRDGCQAGNCSAGRGAEASWLPLHFGKPVSKQHSHPSSRMKEKGSGWSCFAFHT